MKIKKHKEDEMTPAERKRAIEEGKDYDRIPCIPFMGELAEPLTFKTYPKSDMYLLTLRNRVNREIEKHYVK